MGCTDKTSKDDGERWGEMIQLQTLITCVMNACGFLQVCMCVVHYVMCECVPLCVCVCVYVVAQWQGAEGSLFQHQQADESLGPNSPEAELALLLSLFSPSQTQTDTQSQI